MSCIEAQAFAESGGQIDTRILNQAVHDDLEAL
jgi:hypothetical protein